MRPHNRLTVRYYWPRGGQAWVFRARPSYSPARKWNMDNAMLLTALTTFLCLSLGLWLWA